MAADSPAERRDASRLARARLNALLAETARALAPRTERLEALAQIAVCEDFLGPLRLQTQARLAGPDDARAAVLVERIALLEALAAAAHESAIIEFEALCADSPHGTRTPRLIRIAAHLGLSTPSSAISRFARPPTASTSRAASPRDRPCHAASQSTTVARNAALMAESMRRAVTEAAERRARLEASVQTVVADQIRTRLDERLTSDPEPLPADLLVTDRIVALEFTSHAAHRAAVIEFKVMRANAPYGTLGDRYVDLAAHLGIGSVKGVTARFDRQTRKTGRLDPCSNRSIDGVVLA